MLLMDCKEGLDLGEDVVEAPCLDARLEAECVCVHRIAQPSHYLSGRRDGLDQVCELLLDRSGPQASYQCEAACLALWIESFADGYNLIGGGAGADLARNRVVDARHELYVGAIELTCAITHPKQMC